jgi:hypothetical protein
MIADNSASSNAWIVGSNPTWGMDVFVCVYCVCAFQHVEALRRADPAHEDCV